ncbi:hypothetical protein SALBM217S_09890 [Streptomyces griseoloalbus]
MVPEAETRGVLDELQRLRARVPLLAGALAASTDGLVLAHDTPGIEAEGVAALTAAALGVLDPHDGGHQPQLARRWRRSPAG